MDDILDKWLGGFKRYYFWFVLCELCSKLVLIVVCDEDEEDICSECFSDFIWIRRYFYLRLVRDCVIVREWNCMYKLNRVFEELRKVIFKVSYRGEEKLLKIVILRFVIYYILVLLNMLE